MLYNNSLAFGPKSQPTDHYLTYVMCMSMHLFYAARDITSRTLGTIASAMGPCGALGVLGMSATTYLLLQINRWKVLLPRPAREQAKSSCSNTLIHVLHVRPFLCKRSAFCRFREVVGRRRTNKFDVYKTRSLRLKDSSS